MAQSLSRCYLGQYHLCFGESRRKHTIASEIKAHIDLLLSESNEAKQVVQIQKYSLSKDVVEELTSMHVSFVELKEKVKSDAESAVDNGSMTLHRIVSRIREERAYEIPELSSIKTVDCFFDAIFPFYSFL